MSVRVQSNKKCVGKNTNTICQATSKIQNLEVKNY